jgi:membrane protease YdiL (CAAX protease family)
MKPTPTTAAAVVFGFHMAWLGFAFHGSGAVLPPATGFPRVFLSVVLLLAPLWFFGFSGGEPWKRLPATVQVLSASFLALPYFVLCLGTADFRWSMAVMVIAFPVVLAAFLRFSNLPPSLSWRDAAALGLIVAAYFLKWLESAGTYPAPALFAKLFLADVALYCFLVIRQVDAGYSLRPSRSALRVGIREWAFYFPFAFILGELTGFIHFHFVLPDWRKALGALLVTFLFIAIPEELFFRGILQSLLETRLGRSGALVLASVLFGLSHFRHGSAFNWRYVLLASIAGIFYGRAWRAHRQIFAAILTHTLVDVVWSLWFR